MKRIMSKEEFLSVYERQQASGLTIKDFCENETYSSSCFHYWKKKFGLSRTYTSHPDRVPDDTFIPLGLHRRENLPSGTAPSKRLETESLGSAPNILLIKSVNIKICLVLIQILAYIIHSGFISGYQNRYGDNLKPPTNVYHRMTA